MESEQTVISAKLDALRNELEAKELEEQKAEEAAERRERKREAESGEGVLSLHERTPPTKRQLERWAAIDTLKTQVALLEELKAQMETQRTESEKRFLAIQDSTESRHSPWHMSGTCLAQSPWQTSCGQNANLGRTDALPLSNPLAQLLAGAFIGKDVMTHLVYSLWYGHQVKAHHRLERQRAVY